MKPLPYKPFALPTLFALLAIAIASLSRRPAPRPIPPILPTPTESFLARPSSSLPTTQPIHHAYLNRPTPPLPDHPMTLDQIAQFTQKAAGIDVVIDWPHLTSAGIERSASGMMAQQHATLAEFLNQVLTLLGRETVRLGYRADDDRITITTAQEIDAHPVLRIYDIRDVMVGIIQSQKRLQEQVPPAPPEQARGPLSGNGMFASSPFQSPDDEKKLDYNLHQLIVENVDRESWVENGGNFDSIQYLSGRFIIVQSAENHDHISAILKLLRQSLTAGDSHILRYDRLESHAATPKPPADEEPTVTRIYNIRDLLSYDIAFRRAHDIHFTPPAVAPGDVGTGTANGRRSSPTNAVEEQIGELQDIVRDTVDRDSWIDNGGKFGSIKSFSDQLIITQTPANHDKIASLLSQLRQSIKSTPTTHPTK
jgi:hypothetical protein